MKQLKKQSLKKNLLSIGIVGLFAILAIASSGVNKLHLGAFHYNRSDESDTENSTFIVKNDGTRIFGEKIKLQGGVFSRSRISIDGQTFPINEVKAYKEKNIYYGRLKKYYIKRITHGKINVYVDFTESTTGNLERSGNVRSYTRTDYYAQIGEDGEMRVFGGQGDIKKLVKDCPLAYSMANLSNGKMKRAIKRDGAYLNKIFETYNNDCKPVTY